MFYTQAMTTVEVLKKTEFFKNLSEPEQIRLLKTALKQRLDKNQILFHEGAEGSTFYVLVSGAIKLYKTGPDGKEIIIKLVKSGEIFAEVILFEDNRYPVSAAVVKPSIVLAIKRVSFMHLLENPRFRNEFLAAIIRKNRYLTTRILQLAAYDVEARFFQFLDERFGRKEQYTITLSKKDIAAAIGTIPETLSRLLLRLRKRRLIDWQDKQLKLKPGFWNDLEAETDAAE